MSDNQTKKPLFTIITVNYNSGADIVSTIASVKNQVFQNFEYVVIDGGSDDLSKNVLDQNSNLFSVYLSEDDNGIYDAINKGIAHSNGEFILLLHSGDYFESENSLNLISKFITQNELIDVFLSDVLICPRTNITKPVRFYPANIFAISRLRFGIMPPHPAMFFRKEIYNEIGLYDLNYLIASDFDFIVRLFQKDGLKFMYCNDTFIRMIDGGLSHKLSSKIKLQMELLKICKNRGIKTNHFFRLCRFLIKFPGLLQKLQVLRSIFNT